MVRYSEKKYLMKYDLDIQLFNELGLKVKDITPLRKVFILDTDKGKKILKRLDISKEKVEFIDWCTKNIYKVCNKVCTFEEFNTGEIIKKWNNEQYVLMDLLEGREVTFSNPIEYLKATNLLAEVHISGGDVIKNQFKNNNVELIKLLDEDLLSKYKKYLYDTQSIYSWVKQYKYLGEFDKLFLQNADIYIEEMTNAIQLLESSNYFHIRNDYKNLVICHNDLAEHNFLINEEDIKLIDFDYATIDIRVMDLSDILLKGIKNVVFDYEKGMKIIQEYNLSNKLIKDEYTLLYITMLFPKEFYNLVKNYYHRGKEWEEEVFLNRFRNKINNDKYRREFLIKYNKDYSIINNSN